MKNITIGGMEPQPNPKGEGSPLDAAVSKHNGVFALQKLQRTKLARMPILFAIAFIAIIGLAFFACKDGDGPTEQPKARMDNQPAQTLTFTGGTGTYSVTVKSADLYLDADWTADVAKVITALNTAYSSGVAFQDYFNIVFAADQNAVVVLDKNLNNKCEVRVGESRILYLKTASIDSANYGMAAMYMASNTSWVEED